MKKVLPLCVRTVEMAIKIDHLRRYFELCSNPRRKGKRNHEPTDNYLAVSHTTAHAGKPVCDSDAERRAKDRRARALKAWDDRSRTPRYEGGPLGPPSDVAGWRRDVVTSDRFRRRARVSLKPRPKSQAIRTSRLYRDAVTDAASGHPPAREHALQQLLNSALRKAYLSARRLKPPFWSGITRTPYSLASRPHAGEPGPSPLSAAPFRFRNPLRWGMNDPERKLQRKSLAGADGQAHARDA